MSSSRTGHFVTVLLFLGLLPLLPVSAFTQNLYEQPKDYSSVVQKAKAAVFEIKCNGSWMGSGWGLEIEKESFVITAQHVVSDCLLGEPIHARNSRIGFLELELISFDGSYWDFGSTDLALLRANKEIETLRFQDEQPTIGQWVMVVGFPLEDWSGPLVNMSEGRLTAFDSFDHLVTNAAVNGGNSGGPILNSRGEVLGTIYASDPSDEYENLAYAQPLFEHFEFLARVSSLDVQELFGSTWLTRRAKNFPYWWKGS